ncbi:MAG: hypothetical protein JWR69_2014 [Pedosphaera sp.]|nr:hypothetical protein [Pedosphaera sp.]
MHYFPGPQPNHGAPPELRTKTEEMGKGKVSARRSLNPTVKEVVHSVQSRTQSQFLASSG